jgi:drug/metabolite transporter (DMT)-like permease
VAVALDDIPPLLLMSTRFVVAGAIATCIGLAIARRAGEALPSRAAWRDATLVGAGWIGVGMGATAWAGTRLPSGVCALLVATAPLWIALLQALAPGEAAPRRGTLAGVLVGMAGVALLLAPSDSTAGLDLTAAVVLTLAMAGWAASTLYASRTPRAGGLVLSVGMQMLAGGAALLVAAIAAGEHRVLDVASISLAAMQSWTFLLVAASLGGFLAYGWLLEHAGTTIASTHAFVNPVVAIALGAWLLGEPMDARTLLSAIIVVLAVVLLVSAERSGRTAIERERPVDSRPAALPPRAIRPHRPIRPMPLHAAARRGTRSWQSADPMDPGAIDEALDRFDW